MERKVSYKKLWHLLIDKNLKKTDLKELAGISSSTLANITADKHVSMDVLKRICSALNCNVGDIMDFLPDAEKTSSASFNEKNWFLREKAKNE